MPIKILLVEDDEESRRMYRRALAGRDVEILEAHTMYLAEGILRANSDISIIVMDGELGDSGAARTCMFVKKFRDNEFEGHMIAGSSDADIRARLVEAGCSHNIDDPTQGKYGVMSKLVEVLDLVEHRQERRQG